MTFALCVDGSAFIKNIEGLDNAICAFLYICFVADLEYPQVPKQLHIKFTLYSRYIDHSDRYQQLVC